MKIADQIQGIDSTMKDLQNVLVDIESLKMKINAAINDLTLLKRSIVDPETELPNTVTLKDVCVAAKEGNPMEEMTPRLQKLLDETQKIVDERGLPFMSVEDPETGESFVVYSKETAIRKGLIDP